MKFEVLIVGKEKQGLMLVKKILKDKKYRIRMKAKRHE